MFAVRPLFLIRSFGPALLLLLSAPARGDGDLEAARNHMHRGNTLYNLQRYREAAREYEAAYEIKDVPDLLFNIGQAYRGAGDYARALGAYKAYLRSADQANREEVEGHIVDLQKLLAEQKHTIQAPPGAPPPTSVATTPPPSRSRQTGVVGTARADAGPRPVKRTAGIATAVLGVGAIAAGATLTGLAYATQKSLSRPAPGTAYDPAAWSRMRAEQAAGGVLLGVGVGAAIGGAVLAALGRRETARARVSLTPIVGGGVAGLSLAGGF